jgi:hypothetical protein
VVAGGAAYGALLRIKNGAKSLKKPKPNTGGHSKKRRAQLGKGRDALDMPLWPFLPLLALLKKKSALM